MRALVVLLAGAAVAALLGAGACSLKPPFECGGDAGCWGEPDLVVIDAGAGPDLVAPVDLVMPVDLAAHPD